MKFYLDDDSDEDYLISILRSNGFNVISPRDVGMSGKKDEEHLKYTSLNNLVLLTKNHRDFPNIHRKWQRKGLKHSGILLWYQYNNPRKEIKLSRFPRILRNIVQLNLKFENRLYKLNDFNY